ncbi:hypothetical protein GMOD_00005250 [Pyrenophora seminiperda CCB06]|uniref:Uncharacterized protein n=1 Tax=Pyrenophora seminiperda CCB06 TaxID=1302712 RepID=A0A3M7LVB2_9PLEO|nr:hypothetical protein GMOD_00005250 [Pyrenophora seminiperda CCB06]
MASKPSNQTTPAWRLKCGPPVDQLSGSPSSRPSWRERATPAFSSASASAFTSDFDSDPTSSSPRNWRNTSPSAATPPKACKKPDFQDLVEGQILYLRDSVAIQDSLRSNNQGGNPVDHPVVILGKFNKKGAECVQFRHLTSFGGKSLEERKPEHQRHFFLPCESQDGSSPSEGAHIATLEAGSGVLAKRSYVNLSPNSIYQIEYTHLEVYKDQESLRFDTASTSYIKSKVRY